MTHFPGSDRVRQPPITGEILGPSPRTATPSKVTPLSAVKSTTALADPGMSVAPIIRKPDSANKIPEPSLGTPVPLVLGKEIASVGSFRIHAVKPLNEIQINKDPEPGFAIVSTSSQRPISMISVFSETT